MRHIVIASSMLVAALVITFGAASILQGRATSSNSASSQPFAVIEAAKPAPGKMATSKDRAPSQFRERGAHSASAQVGL